MASGIFGQAALTAATNTTIYTVPANTVATITLSVCNIGSELSYFRAALCSANTPSSAEYIEFNTEILINSTFERSGIVMQADKKLVVYSSVAGIAVTAYGFEE